MKGSERLQQPSSSAFHEEVIILKGSVPQFNLCVNNCKHVLAAGSATLHNIKWISLISVHNQYLQNGAYLIRNQYQEDDDKRAKIC